MTHSLRHRGFGQSSRLALAVALAIPGAIALPVVAHAQEAAQDYNIAGGDLGAALQRYSAASGVQLVYSSDLVAGKRSPGVSGRMSPQQALGQLLAGTGLSARVSGNTATLVQGSASGDVAAAEGERLLGPVRVEGSHGGSYQTPVRGDGIAQLGGIRGGQDEEAVGYRAKVASATTGTPVALEDVPRSITVQTQEQIEKQDIRTIGEALERTPGVAIIQSPGATGAGGTIYARGYEVTHYQIDGEPGKSFNDNAIQSLSGNLTSSLDAYERVELVRGPNALFAGEGSLGGSVNLVRKRPGLIPSASIQLAGGSFERLSATADVSTPSLLGSNVGFRGVASVRREGADYDKYLTSNYLLYGILDVPLGEDARLELGYQRNWSHSKGLYGGIPRTVEGSLLPIPRKFNFNSADSYISINSQEVFLKTYADLGGDWDFEAGATYSKSTGSYSPSLYVANFRDDGSMLFPGYLGLNKYEGGGSDQLAVYGKLTGKFDTFGLTHNVFLNASYSRSDYGGGQPAGDGYQAEILSIDDLFNPEYIFYPAGPLGFYSYMGSYNSTASAVFGDTVSLRGIVDVSAVFRYDMYSSVAVDFARDLTNGSPIFVQYDPVYGRAGSISQKGSLRPTYSVQVRPIEKLTVYGSYSDGFRRQDALWGRTGTGSDTSYFTLSPATFRNIEFGAKYATRNALVSLSLYDTKGSNSGYADGTFLCPPLPSRTVPGEFRSPCYGTGADSTSRGAEFEFTGKVANGLNVIASASYGKAKSRIPPELLFDPDDADLPLVTQAPNVDARLFLDWTPAFAPDWSIQLGARYRGRVYQVGTRQFYDSNGDPIGSPEPFEFEENPFFTVDLGVDYRVSEDLSLRLFVENVTDATYLQTVSSSTSGGNFYGRPRSFLASLNWKHVGSRNADNAGGSTGVIFGKASDWYLGVDVGATRHQTLNGKAEGLAQDGTTNVRWGFELKDAPTAFARVGYYVLPHVRAELEGGFRSSAMGDIGGASVAPVGVCGARGSTAGVPFDCDDVTGSSQNWSLLGNVIYDIPLGGGIRPFLGVGAGLSRSAISFGGKLEGIGGATPWQIITPTRISSDFARQQQETVLGQSVHTAFAWQLIAGVSVPVSDRLSIDVTYRNFRIPSLKWTSANAVSAGGMNSVIGNFSGSSSTSAMTIGVKWALGAK